MTPFNLETLKAALPTHLRKRVDQDFLDEINNKFLDVDMRDTILDNVLSYSSVLDEGKYKLSTYLNAVQYCTHKLMGASNLASYVKTFPDRYARLVANGNSEKDIHAHVTMYNKNALVNKIMAQAMIPVHIINSGYYQEAINKKVSLMRNAKSERIQLEAANGLTADLRPPEIKKIELDVGLKESSLIDDLLETTAKLAAQQRELIEAKVLNAKDVATQKLFLKTVETVEVENATYTE